MNELLAACRALVGIVEGQPIRWAGDGVRLKDTPEWVAFYCATNRAAAPPSDAPECECDRCPVHGYPSPAEQPKPATYEDFIRLATDPNRKPAEQGAREDAGITCARCKGSGEGTVQVGVGPDAYDAPVMCEACGGSGAFDGTEPLRAFPTMLRKMWSGGDVQRWIDENIAPAYAAVCTMARRAPPLAAGRVGVAEARSVIDRVVTDALTRTDGTGMFRVSYVDPDSVKNEVAKRQIFSGGDSIGERLGELVDEYEYRGDGDYTPNENERALLLDFAMGLPEDDILMGLFTKPAAPRAGLTDGQIANAVAVLRELTGESKIDMPDQRADYLARMARRIFALAGPLVTGEVEPVAPRVFVSGDVIRTLRDLRLRKMREVVDARPKVRTNGDAAELRKLEAESDSLRVAIEELSRPLVYADTAKGG